MVVLGDIWAMPSIGEAENHLSSFFHPTMLIVVFSFLVWDSAGLSSFNILQLFFFCVLTCLKITFFPNVLVHIWPSVGLTYRGPASRWPSPSSPRLPLRQKRWRQRGTRKRSRSGSSFGGPSRCIRVPIVSWCHLLSQLMSEQMCTSAVFDCAGSSRGCLDFCQRQAAVWHGRCQNGSQVAACRKWQGAILGEWPWVCGCLHWFSIILCACFGQRSQQTAVLDVSKDDHSILR